MEMNTSECPPNVIQHVQSIDLALESSANVYSFFADSTKLKCQLHCLLIVADRLDVSSDPQVIDGFCGSVATYSRFFEPEQVDRIKAAYLRFLYDKDFAYSYFAGLRLCEIDIRKNLLGKIEPDWSFSSPRNNAETWQYYTYLAVLGEPGAYDALEKKIDGTINGNEVTMLLQSLAELRTEEAKKILLKYSDDTRHAEGPVGPGMQVSETVELLLGMYYSK